MQEVCAFPFRWAIMLKTLGDAFGFPNLRADSAAMQLIQATRSHLCIHVRKCYSLWHPCTMPYALRSPQAKNVKTRVIGKK